MKRNKSKSSKPSGSQSSNPLAENIPPAQEAPSPDAQEAPPSESAYPQERSKDELLKALCLMPIPQAVEDAGEIFLKEKVKPLTENSQNLPKPELETSEFQPSVGSILKARLLKDWSPKAQPAKSVVMMSKSELPKLKARRSHQVESPTESMKGFSKIDFGPVSKASQPGTSQPVKASPVTSQLIKAQPVTAEPVAGIDKKRKLPKSTSRRSRPVKPTVGSKRNFPKTDSESDVGAQSVKAQSVVQPKKAQLMKYQSSEIKQPMEEQPTEVQVIEIQDDEVELVVTSEKSSPKMPPIERMVTRSSYRRSLESTFKVPAVPETAGSSKSSLGESLSSREISTSASPKKTSLKVNPAAVKPKKVRQKVGTRTRAKPVPRKVVSARSDSTTSGDREGPSYLPAKETPSSSSILSVSPVEAEIPLAIKNRNDRATERMIISAFCKKVRNADESPVRLNENVEHLRQTVIELITDLNAKTMELEDLKEVHAELTNKFKHLEWDHLKLTDVNIDLSTYNTNLNVVNTQLTDQLDSLASEIRALEIKNQRMQLREGDYATNMRRLKIYEKEYRELKSVYDLLNKRCGELTDEQQKFIVNYETLYSQAVVMQEEVFESHLTRRNLHNTIHELKGNLRIICRVRPPTSRERDKVACAFTFPSEHCVELQRVRGTQPIDCKVEFHFDKVLQPTATQADCFEEISSSIQSALDGYDVTVLAYGETGSGKTYTLHGVDFGQCQGLIHRTITYIFNYIEYLGKFNWVYDVKVSFLEIYDENLRDLLDPRMNQNPPLEILVNEDTGLTVNDLRIRTVDSLKRFNELMNEAQRNRATANTNFREHCSKSHAVYKISLFALNDECNGSYVGSVTLVDLAGSESPRPGLTEAVGPTINLHVLGNVLLALYNKDQHVPFQDSKLTCLLQLCLGYGAKTLLIVHVPTFEDCYPETLKTLRFGSRIKEVKIRRIKTLPQHASFSDVRSGNQIPPTYSDFYIASTNSGSAHSNNIVKKALQTINSANFGLGDFLISNPVSAPPGQLVRVANPAFISSEKGTFPISGQPCQIIRLPNPASTPNRVRGVSQANPPLCDFYRITSQAPPPMCNIVRIPNPATIRTNQPSTSSGIKRGTLSVVPHDAFKLPNQSPISTDKLKGKTKITDKKRGGNQASTSTSRVRPIAPAMFSSCNIIEIRNLPSTSTVKTIGTPQATTSTDNRGTVKASYLTDKNRGTAKASTSTDKNRCTVQASTSKVKNTVQASTSTDKNRGTVQASTSNVKGTVQASTSTDKNRGTVQAPTPTVKDRGIVKVSTTNVKYRGTVQASTSTNKGPIPSFIDKNKGKIQTSASTCDIGFTNQGKRNVQHSTSCDIRVKKQASVYTDKVRGISQTSISRAAIKRGTSQASGPPCDIFMQASTSNDNVGGTNQGSTSNDNQASTFIDNQASTSNDNQDSTSERSLYQRSTSFTYGGTNQDSTSVRRSASFNDDTSANMPSRDFNLDRNP
ncbi:hypothetical protein JTB14_013641 [Gonioctena quinquepunctata]|nr:hypothetical protein JTB14_013641 [Gonioctena quinquepunctata]